MKLKRKVVPYVAKYVSLCVREWIETSAFKPADLHGRRLPLREGVD